MKNSEFKKALSIVSKIKNNNCVNDTYVGTVLLNNSKIWSTDLETTVSVDVPFFTGSTILSLQKLKKLSAAIPAKSDIALSVDIAGVTTVKIDGEAKFQLGKLGDPKKYIVPNNDAIETFALPIDKLMRSVPHMSKDELRMSMCGIFVDDENIVATDAHTLFKSAHGAKVDTSFIIPASAVKLLDKSEEPVFAVHRERNLFSFTQGAQTVYFSAIDAKFPAYMSVWPEPNQGSKAIVSKSDLVPIIKMAKVAAHDTTKLISITLNGAIVVRAQDLDYRNEFVSSVPGTAIGEMKIGYNADLLLKAIASVPGDALEIDMKAINSASTINGEVLVMPCLISQV